MNHSYSTKSKYILNHTQALAQVGVKEVVIAINYQADHIKKTLDPL